MSTKKEAYLCLSAMVRAKEPKLLNADRANRMLEAATYEEAAKLLTDSGYDDMSQMTTKGIEAYLHNAARTALQSLKNPLRTRQYSTYSSSSMTTTTPR